jgi:phosphoribosyl 1,2-cyclic phosphodiesterase
MTTSTPALRFSVLGSGSKGNAVYVECGATAILVDCGFSGREIERRLAVIDRSLERLDAILVTHEHNDHVAGVGVLSRRCRIPVHGNPATLATAEARTGKPHAWAEFDTGGAFSVGELRLRAFAISHDTVDPVGFVISNGHVALGCCTDTGKVTRLIAHQLGRCQALVLESNHDPEMLRTGPYPLQLQQRIQSSQGHLTNEDCGCLLRDLARAGLRQAVLAHLSETNNQPGLALRTVQTILGDAVEGLELSVAAQDQPSGLIEVRSQDSP